ncbi:amelotin [Thomomys bottae]
MKTTILLFCLLGSTQSLPKQLNPTSGYPPTKPTPEQVTLLNQQQPHQVFPSLSLIPLTHLFTLASDLQLLSHATGIAPGTHTLPLTLGTLNGQQQLPSQMLPIIVASLGAQGAILSSEELPLASQIFTGLLIHPLLPGNILPTSQTGATAGAQDGVFPAGQTGVKPAISGTTEGPISTPSVTDDDFGGTTPAGIRRGMHTSMHTTVEETTAD